MITRQCKEHCKSVGETPLQHFVSALQVALELQILVVAVTIHAFIPRWFTHTATNYMKRILARRR
jgi:hypothetical protein